MRSFLCAAWIRQWPWSLHEGEAAVTTSKLRPLVSSHHQSRETKATEGGNVTLRASKLHHLRKLNLPSWCWCCPEALSLRQFLRWFMLCIFHFVCTLDVKILQCSVLTQLCNQKTRMNQTQSRMLFTHYVYSLIVLSPHNKKLVGSNPSPCPPAFSPGALAPCHSPNSRMYGCACTWLMFAIQWPADLSVGISPPTQRHLGWWEQMSVALKYIPSLWFL